MTRLQLAVCLLEDVPGHLQSSLTVCDRYLARMSSHFSYGCESGSDGKTVGPGGGKGRASKAEGGEAIPDQGKESKHCTLHPFTEEAMHPSLLSAWPGNPCLGGPIG